ncbi:MAG: glycine cleavage system aminomethyltransferase GcvT [Alphaproteobacteria bacterium]|nr:glycine cleavage system aminomethyltransferase GcvT [Alphaproteobacteria bacterium]
MNTLKKTPFYNFHSALQAKISPFAGYEMPVYYNSIVAEHNHVRQAAGVFDVSHMGEFIIEGAQSLQLLQKITINDVSVLIPGKAQYSCLINEQAGVIDDLIIYCLVASERYMLVVNASNIIKDWHWIEKQALGFDVSLTNISEETCLLAVQGPKVTQLLTPYLNFNLADLPYYHFKIANILGIKDIIISHTGYTGAGGVELYFKNEADNAAKLWNLLTKDLQIPPIGLGARDSLRLEKGYCLYGHELNDNITPLEAGLGWITKFNKDFIGSDILKQQKQAGVTQKLVGLWMLDKSIPRQGYHLLNAAGTVIGSITSGTMSPILQKGIALGYVDIAYSKLESSIFVNIRNQAMPAQIVKLPFV